MSPRWIAAALVALTPACASLFGTTPAPPRPPEDVPIFSTATGQRVDLAAVLAAIDASDVVVLGELHGHPAGLALNAALFERSLARNPDAALCLEFLTRETQFLVDAYLDGLIEWDALEEACEDVRGSRPGPHRPMIEAARAARVPVIAANAPRLYTSAAREHGYERLTELTPKQQELFDILPSVPSGSYRSRFFERTDEHDDAKTPEERARLDERLESFFRAQCLWDMTMASSVSRALDDGHAPAFLVVGSFHCNADGGTVQMIRLLRSDARTLVVTFVAEDSDHLKPDHSKLADYVAYVGPLAEDED